MGERKQKNIEFHLLIGEATKNPVLTLTIDLLMDSLFELKIKTFKLDPRFTVETIADHREILMHLKEQNGKLAERGMVRHLERIQRYFTKYIICDLEKRLPDGRWIETLPSTQSENGYTFIGDR